MKEIMFGATEIGGLVETAIAYDCIKEIYYNGEWIHRVDLEDYLYENYEYRFSILEINNIRILKVYD